MLTNQQMLFSFVCLDANVIFNVIFMLFDSGMCNSGNREVGDH